MGKKRGSGDVLEGKCQSFRICRTLGLSAGKKRPIHLQNQGALFS